MLQNKTLKIKNSIQSKRLHLWFIMITVVLITAVAVFMPEMIRVLNKEVADANLLSYAPSAFMIRGIPAFLVGLVFALFASKKFSSDILVQLIRFFLITFMLLAGLIYIASQ